jgi:hypothetical protein
MHLACALAHRKYKYKAGGTPKSYHDILPRLLNQVSILPDVCKDVRCARANIADVVVVRDQACIIWQRIKHGLRRYQFRPVRQLSIHTYCFKFQASSSNCLTRVTYLISTSISKFGVLNFFMLLCTESREELWGWVSQSPIL